MKHVARIHARKDRPRAAAIALPRFFERASYGRRPIRTAIRIRTPWGRWFASMANRKVLGLVAIFGIGLAGLIATTCGL